MSTFAISFVAFLFLAVAIRVLEERGIKCIGLAPHQVKFPGPSAVPFFGNFLEVRDLRWRSDCLS